MTPPLSSILEARDSQTRTRTDQGREADLRPWVATVRRPGVVWLARVSVPGHLLQLPELPCHVTHALRLADDLARRDGCVCWPAAVCEDAAHLLLFGNAQDEAVRGVIARRQQHKVVRCVDEVEARRVAAILALSGDVAIVHDTGIGIFPERPMRRPAARTADRF